MSNTSLARRGASLSLSRAMYLCAPQVPRARIPKLGSDRPLPKSLAKSCYNCKQHFARPKNYHLRMGKTPARQALAENLQLLMDRSESLRTQTALAKKAGVSQTSISQMKRPGNAAAKSPKLDQVEKVAAAFGLAAWQMLIDRRALGEEMADLLMRPSPPGKSGPNRRHDDGRPQSPESRH